MHRHAVGSQPRTGCRVDAQNQAEMSMRAACLCAALVLSATGSESVAGTEIRLTGDWSRTDGEARISIAQCGERLCAVNTWVKDPSKGERVGDRLVMSVQPREPATLAGEAVDVRRGLTYSLMI